MFYRVDVKPLLTYANNGFILLYKKKGPKTKSVGGKQDAKAEEMQKGMSDAENQGVSTIGRDREPTGGVLDRG